MAFLNADDKLKKEGEEQPTTNGGGQSFVTGQGASDVGQATSTAGVGGGGAGNWTNIQAYMNADKGNTAATDQLTKHVNPALEKEKSNLESSVSKMKTDVERGTGNILDTSNAQADFQKAQELYQFDQQPGAIKGKAAVQGIDPEKQNQYKSITGKYGEFLNRNYAGPKSFDYTIGNEATKYKEAAKSDDAFQGLMSDVYSKKSQQVLTPGQLALQRQLNVSNESLGKARENILKQYSDIEAARGKGVSDISSAIKGSEEKLRTNQNQIRDWLQGESGNQSRLNEEAQNTAKAEYDAAKDKVIYVRPGSHSGQIRYKDQPMTARYVEDYAPTGAVNEFMYHQNPKEIKEAMQAYENFKGGQYALRKDAGQENRRNYNAILDFLGSGEAKKARDFDVRGA